MKPFDDYPNSGREPIGLAKGTDCRHGYGLQFMQKTGQTKCAYCGADFAESYDAWLTMSIDHVVPINVCKSLHIPDEWADDCANKVLACMACNSFKNRYVPTDIPQMPISFGDFTTWRDKVFTKRKELVKQSRERERAFFDEKRWLD